MITKIEIEGYRLLNGFTADLGPLTVVIGANAVGKSTLLDCLQCIAQCADVALNTALGSHGGINSLLNVATKDRRLTWRVTFNKSGGLIWNSLPTDNEDMVYEVTLLGDIQGQADVQYEVLRKLQPHPGYSNPMKFLEATPYRHQIFDREAHRLVAFDDARPQSVQVREASSETNDGNANLTPPAVQERALLLSQIRFFNEFPIPSSARVLLRMMAFYPGFDVTKNSPLRTKSSEIKATTYLSPNGENIGTVLHEILNRYEYRGAANELREFLRAAYPSFEEIHCDTTPVVPAQVLLRVREKGMDRSMELWELSDGMCRFLCLGAALLNPIAPLIAIDEPELGLHPRLLPVVADMIKAASERTQVLISTHSPDFLNRFEIEHVAVMARAFDEPKAVWFRPADRKTLVDMLKDVAGETLGDLHRSGELEAMA